MVLASFLFGAFFIMMFAGVPIAASLGLAGTLAIATGKLGIMAFPTNVYAGIAKYPLLAIPMFVLAGAIFDRAGVAERLLRFTEAIIGHGRGALAVITILVAMVIGGISGSGPACTAAVGGVMLVAMLRAGYAPGFAAAVTAAVIKASAGAAHWLPVTREVNLTRTIDYLKERGFWIYGADADQGTDINQFADVGV